MNDLWDRRLLGLAQYIAAWSKDPSTKTGAVLALERRVVAVGYNGFPPGIADDERLQDRETKYALIVHAERNAVLNAKRDVEGCTLYTWPWGGCTPCASLVITAGIRRVVAPPCPADRRERWAPDLDRAEALYREAGVEVVELGL